jgi:hypothetical protein
VHRQRIVLDGYNNEITKNETFSFDYCGEQGLDNCQENCGIYPGHNITGCTLPELNAYDYSEGCTGDEESIRICSRKARLERRLSCSNQYYEFCQVVAESEQNLNYPYLQRCYDRGDGNRVLMVDTRDKIAGTHSYTDCVHGWKPTLKESSFHSSIAGPTYAMKYFDETMRKEDIAPEYAWAKIKKKNGISPDLLLGPSVVIDAYNGDFIHSYGHARISYPLSGEIIIKSTNKGFEWTILPSKEKLFSKI